VIGGSSGIGLELRASIAAFDATDFNRLVWFFDALPPPIDHLLVTGPGPCHVPPAGFDPDAARRHVDAHLLLPLQVARHAAGKIRPGGTCCSWAASAAAVPQRASRSSRRSRQRCPP